MTHRTHTPVGETLYGTDSAMDTLSAPETITTRCTRELLAEGCTHETNDGRTGWWQDGVFLADNARDALAALRG